MSVRKRLRVLPRRVRVHDPEEVTTAAAEVDPVEAGLTAEDVEAIWQSVVKYYRTGLQPAIALCIRRNGLVILDRAIGHASGNGPQDPEDGDKVLATPQTLFNLFSGSKCVLAMLVHMLGSQGKLHIDDRVTEYIPEFGKNGKEAITIRHILGHRAGIPAVPGDSVDLDLLARPKEVLQLICEAKPESVAGRSLAYHAVTGGFVLGEIVERVSGESLRTLHDRTVRTPLAFENLRYGVPQDKLHMVAKDSFTGPRPRPPFSRLLERSLGLGIADLVRLANDPRFLTGVVPSGNVIGTANEIGRFFELLLRQGTLDGVRVFDPRIVQRAVAEQSYMEIDRIIMLPIRYSLGFMLGSEHMSFYGRGTPKAFGHLGFTNVLAWADPERDISVALMNNGKPFVTPALLLWLNIMRVTARRIPRQSP